MRHLSSTLAGVLLAGLGLTACAHKPPPPTAAPEPSPPAAAVTPASPAPPAATACQRDEQCPSGQLCLQQVCTEITPSLAACGVIRVHFDFDADTLRSDDAPRLQRAARCIEANNPAHVLIAGNADERGTVEYNLALGQRRAAAVRAYLARLGVTEGKLDTISYGEEMPLCTQHDEACWQRNRRSAIRAGESDAEIEAKAKAERTDKP